VKKKPIKSRKPEKKITEKLNRKTKSIKLIRIFLKLTGSVQFQFYKSEIKKTEPKSEKN